MSLACLDYQAVELSPQSALAGLGAVPVVKGYWGRVSLWCAGALDVVRAVLGYFFSAVVAKDEVFPLLAVQAGGGGVTDGDGHRVVELELRVLATATVPAEWDDACLAKELQASCAGYAGKLAVPVRFAAPVVTAWGVAQVKGGKALALGLCLLLQQGGVGAKDVGVEVGVIHREVAALPLPCGYAYADGTLQQMPLAVGGDVSLLPLVFGSAGKPAIEQGETGGNEAARNDTEKAGDAAGGEELVEAVAHDFSWIWFLLGCFVGAGCCMLQLAVCEFNRKADAAHRAAMAAARKEAAAWKEVGL